MNENISARDELATIYQKKCMEFFNLVHNLMDGEAYDEFFGLYKFLIRTADELARYSDEEIEIMRYQERVIYPICPKMEVYDPTKPVSHKPLVLDKLCDRKDCADYDTCWATTQLHEPSPSRLLPDTVLDLEREMVQKDWSPFRKFLYSLGKPTPSLATPEEEEVYYLKLEEEYRKRGEWP